MFKSTSLPDIEAKLPADLRASGAEVLVAKQMSSSSQAAVLIFLPEEHSAPTLTVNFMKASDLVAFSKTLKRGSTMGLALVLPFSKFGLGGVTSEQLEKVCVVVEDGRVIGLVDDHSGWQPMSLDAGRREAMVAALSAGGTSPFVGVDGPCGVSGKAEWPAELRSRVIDFLVRIPVFNSRLATSDLGSNDVLAETLRDSWTTETQAQIRKSGAILLISATWRGVAMAERPRFLTAEEFDRFSASKVTAGTDAIITLLPKYVSGSYDPSNVSVASFCLISSDGRTISAAGSTYLETRDAGRPDWRDEAVTRLRSGSGSWDAAFRCIPSDTNGWSSEDRAAAIEFLAAIPGHR